jgi:glycosyltransferase involved in cell wall biosynthesis
VSDMSISICICTYNRSTLLDDTLRRMSAMTNLFQSSDELLIIDNNSSDASKAVVDSFASQLPIKYFFEAEQGLSAARNRALCEFTNSLLIFIDDDVLLTEQCVATYRHALNAYPDAGFFGGKLSIDWQGNRPRWYRDESMPLLDGVLIRYDLGSANLAYHKGSRLPYGANFALRRRLIDQTGQFDVALGVKGEQIGRGEETDYFMRALNANFQGMYLADALAQHKYHGKRLSSSYLFRYGIEKGRAEVLLNNARPEQTYRKILSYSVRALGQLAKGRVDRYFQCVISVGIIYGVDKFANQTVALSHE